MAKQYFSTKQKPRLGKITAGIVVVLAVGFGIAKVLMGGGTTTAPTVETASGQADPSTLKTAQTRVIEGDWKGARELLTPLLESSKGTPDAARAIMLMAEVEQAEGNNAAALTLLEGAYKEYAGSPEYPEIAANYANCLELAQKETEAQAVYKDLMENAPPETHGPALLGMARAAEKSEKLVEARDLYRKALGQTAFGTPQYEKTLDGLGALNVKLIFSPQETPESRSYTIGSGDNLLSIGVKLNTTQGLLMRANGLDEGSTLRLGQRIKYTPKDFRIIIERSTCTLYLCDKDGVFKRYKTGMGKPGHETTLGSYTLGNKQKDPPWFKPGEGEIPPGDPRNELGTRWMPLVPTAAGLPTDLGIHGTIAPESIGHFSSHGCARMHNAEVEELYDIVVRSTPVDIVEKVDPANFSAAAVIPTESAPSETPPTPSPDEAPADADAAAPVEKAPATTAPATQAPTAKKEPTKAPAAKNATPKKPTKQDKPS